MSWNRSMVREAYKDGSYVELKRIKTGRKIKVQFEPHEYPEIITKLNLEIGEVLKDSKGTEVIVTGFPGPGMRSWTYKPYCIEFMKKKK